MRFWTAATFLFLISLSAKAQYTNSWVVPGQTYYQISLAEDGVYRLTYSDLQQAGLPLNVIDPRLVQIFHRGVEQAIFVKHDQSPADGNFDTGEYIEFYGRRNDGTLDAGLYNPSTSQPHKYYNLYSDTAAYFLTWNTTPVQGKRMELFNQINSNNIPKELAHQEERRTVYTSEYGTGRVLEKYITQSFFDQGEGWTGATICTNNLGCAGIEQRDFPIDLVSNGVTSVGQPQLEIQIAGRDAIGHAVEIYVGPTAGALRLLNTYTFSDFQTPVYSLPFNWSDVGGDGKMIVRVKGLGVGGNRERVSVSYIRVTFPQSFSLTTSFKELGLLPNAGGKSYIELTTPPAGTRLWDITDPSNIVSIGTQTAGPLLTAIVPNTTGGRKLLAFSVNKTVQTSQIKRVSFRSINTAANFLIISHASLTKPGLTYGNPVTAYGGYRASAAGGGYDTLTITMDQLYNQFSYGETSPIAIYEFMRLMVGQGNPKYLLLIGKGRDVASAYYRNAHGPSELKDLVPTAGNPGSDIVFTAGLKGAPYIPTVPTGRLTASTPAQVAAYLNKVKEAEALDYTNFWRKNVLHLSGGIDPSDLDLFKSYVDEFTNIAKDEYVGANVTTLRKHSTQSVEFINISQQVNAGVNMVMFFGHSSSTDTDIDIGRVSEPIFGYNNPGKYPAFLVNGCNAGEFFTNGTNFGEDWTLAANKGARNFIANSSFGYPGALRLYTSLFYEVGFADSSFMRKGIGDVQKEVARRYLDFVGYGPTIFVAQIHQMVLLGDPALKLFGSSKPDFEVSDAALTVKASDGKTIHALSDSLQLSIVVKNFGRVEPGKINVRITHQIGDEVRTYDSLYNSILYQDTLKFTIRRGTSNFFGNNRISVTLDPDDLIKELSNDNNTGQWQRQIAFNGTKNLQPQDYSIVSTTGPTFVFQDTDVLAGSKSYNIELDTVPSFNSGFKQSKTITGKVLLKTQFQLLNKDSLVYYWRTKPSDKTADQWQQTSFSLIKNSGTGWAQINFDQLSNNELSNLVENNGDKRVDFKSTSVSIFIKTFGSANVTPGASGSFQVDNAEYYFSPQGFNCRNNTINLVAFDKSSVVPYLGIPFTFQNAFGRACGREPQLINSFTSAEVETGNNDDLFRYVDSIKPGDSVVMFSMGDAGFNTWSVALRNKLGEFGIRASDIAAFSTGEPVIILGKKGAPAGTARIIKSTTGIPQEQELQLNEELTGRLTTGQVSSLTVGPALKWNRLTTRMKEKTGNDVVKMDVFGIKPDGREAQIYSGSNLTFNLDEIDAKVFPFIRLQAKLTDEVDLTASQINRWIVTYDPAPDGLLIYEETPLTKSVAEGAAVASKFGFINISPVAFTDSLSTKFSVFNQLKGTTEEKTFKIKGPAAGDTTHFVVSPKTRSKLGLNDYSVNVNFNLIPEQYYQNNDIELAGYLNVLKDKSNPVLDVTVDGRILNNADFVSRNPLIRITLSDENIYLPVSDTTSVNVLLTYPCTSSPCKARRISYSGKELTWSVSSSGMLTVLFQPKDLPDGQYTLDVTAHDVSGNPVAYEVDFVVEREPSVTFASPYPNPSSFGFFFDFQTSGDVAPEGFELIILDRNGREVVRYDETMTTALRVGSNQMSWSGKDPNGYLLAEGLYYYRWSVINAGKAYRKTGSLLVTR